MKANRFLCTGQPWCLPSCWSIQNACNLQPVAALFRYYQPSSALVLLCTAVLALVHLDCVYSIVTVFELHFYAFLRAPALAFNVGLQMPGAAVWILLCGLQCCWANCCCCCCCCTTYSITTDAICICHLCMLRHLDTADSILHHYIRLHSILEPTEVHVLFRCKHSKQQQQQQQHISQCEIGLLGLLLLLKEHLLVWSPAKSGCSTICYSNAALASLTCNAHMLPRAITVTVIFYSASSHMPELSTHTASAVLNVKRDVALCDSSYDRQLVTSGVCNNLLQIVSHPPTNTVVYNSYN